MNLQDCYFEAAKNFKNKTLNQVEWAINKIDKKIKKSIKNGKTCLEIKWKCMVGRLHKVLSNEHLLKIICEHYNLSGFDITYKLSSDCSYLSQQHFTVHWASEAKLSDEIVKTFQEVHKKLNS